MRHISIPQTLSFDYDDVSKNLYGQTKRPGPTKDLLLAISDFLVMSILLRGFFRISTTDLFRTL